MNELDPQFEQSLVRLVRKADERDPDWRDVVERASAARRRTQLLATIGAILLAAVVSAGLAFGPQLWRIAAGKQVDPKVLSADEKALLAAISSGRPLLRTQPDSPQVRALGRNVSIRLLARRGRYRFYLIHTHGRRDQTCVATGREGAPHLFGSISCPLEPRFPSVKFPIFDQSVWGQRRGQPFRVFRLQGFAADAIAEVGLLVNDDVVAKVRVRDNTYLRTTGLPKETPRAIVAIDRSGHRFYCGAAGPSCTQDVNELGPPVRSRRLPHRPPSRVAPHQPPARHTFPLGRHLQHGDANGVSVEVYEPGAAVFRLRDLSPRTRRLLSTPPGAGYSCLRVRFYRGKWLEDGSGTTARLAPQLRLDLKFDLGRASVSPDLPPPYDGCEIAGYYGHHWNDAFGTRAPVEVPLTAAGRQFFNDRAAARDLAYFVRSRRLQRIRRSEDPRPQLEALADQFGKRVVELPDRRQFAPENKIGFWVGSHMIVFTTTSSTGRQFFVAAKRATLRLLANNLGDLAFVF